MSNNKTNSLNNNNIVYSKITNGFNDEEILINNNDQENDGNNNYQYYNNIYNKTNNMEEEDDEKSDDTIVAFQEEKNSNLIESNENLFLNNKLPREIEDEELDNKNNIDKKDNNKENLDNNNIISKNTKTSLISKKSKKKKKKKKKEKNEKIEIFAQDKDKNKLKQIKLNSILKKKNSKKFMDKKFKNEEKKEKNLILKKLTNPLNIQKSKSLSKSIKAIPNNLKRSSELSPSKIIYENGVSDDEEEIKKIAKKRKKKKIHLKPIMTPFLLSIKEKNEYNIRLQKIRQQFTEKKFIHEQKFFYYVLKPGNGATLVKNSLKHRTNWKEAQMNVTSLFNFKWQTSTFCIDFKNLSSVESIPQIVNHFECHNSLSNKSNMFLNLFEYCENNNINIWKYVPLTVFINPSNENEKCFDILYDNINKYIFNYNDINENLNIKQKEEKYSNLFKTMTFKVFGRRKDVPKDTWMMGSRTPLQIPDMHYDGKNFWVLKASNLNRGQCIRLIDSKEKFHEIIKDWSQGINLKGINKGTTENNIQIKINNDNNQNKGDEIPMSEIYTTEKIIVQKYIEKPLCYYGRKCDMRVWVLLTQSMKVYIYKEGHLKTCSEKFDINNNKDAFIHITNYSFQKHCLNFQKFELGNEVPFYDFQKYLDKEYKDKKVNVRDHIMNQVKYIVELTMKSVREKINPNKRNFCFEIFGYDFMMDVNLNVYLLEINTNPGLEISSPWIKAIVPRMVDDALRLTIDEVFPTKYQFDKNIIHELNYEDYSNDLSNKIVKNEEKNNEGEGVARIIKRKKYVDICDQGSGTQDKEGEKYIQENLRQKEVTIQKKINDKNKIIKENTKVNENKNEKNIKDNNSINKDKIKITITLNSNKKENEIKEEKEKEFNQKDYISPFPVPGYEPWENLWEFVCELIEEEKIIQNNNVVAGLRGLLEIQKKRQTISAPNNNNNNKRVNTKNNIENMKNNNNIKEKIIKNNNENIKKSNINKEIKKSEKKEIKMQFKKSKGNNQIDNKKIEKEKNKDIEEYMKDKNEVMNSNKEKSDLEKNNKDDIISKNEIEEEKNVENNENIKKEKENYNLVEDNKTGESSNIINDNLENNKKDKYNRDDDIELDSKDKNF